jgi:hypothetical protein
MLKENIFSSPFDQDFKNFYFKFENFFLSTSQVQPHVDNPGQLFQKIMEQKALRYGTVLEIFPKTIFTFGMDIEKAKNIHQDYIQFIDSSLIKKNEIDCSNGTLAQALGVKGFMHTPKDCDALISILQSGNLLVNNPHNENKESLYQGVYFQGFSQELLRTGLIFDPIFLDQFQNYHLSQGWIFGRYSTTHATALHNDQKRMIYHFTQIAKNHRYRNELVIRQDVSLDYLSQVIVSPGCYQRIKLEHSPVFERYQLKLIPKIINKFLPIF